MLVNLTLPQISILSHVAKIFESYIGEQITHQFESNNLFCSKNLASNRNYHVRTLLTVWLMIGDLIWTIAVMWRRLLTQKYSLVVVPAYKYLVIKLTLTLDGPAQSNQVALVINLNICLFIQSAFSQTQTEEHKKRSRSPIFNSSALMVTLRHIRDSQHGHRRTTRPAIVCLPTSKASTNTKLGAICPERVDQAVQTTWQASLPRQSFLLNFYSFKYTILIHVENYYSVSQCPLTMACDYKAKFSFSIKSI